MARADALGEGGVQSQVSSVNGTAYVVGCVTARHDE
jgi:hypothetical protein